MGPNPVNLLRKAFALRAECSKNNTSLEQLQQEKLEKILDSAYNAPYYRELFDDLDLSSKSISEDLQLLPPTDKNRVRKDASQFLTTAKPLPKFLTSGSTGTPGETYVDRDALDHRIAIGLISMHEMGRSPTDLFAEVVRTEMKMFPVLSTLGLFRKFFMSIFMDEAELFNILCKKKPDIMGWYPSMSHSLAILNNARGNPLRLRNVFSSGEVLSRNVKKDIEESFSCRVIQQYASVEFSAMAWDCPEGNLHVHSPSFIIEILDDKGKPKKNGVGDIAVTCLSNHAMPLIRYRIGDMARWGRCSCGKETPVLESIVGRSDDMIILPSGRMRNPFGFNLLYYGEQINGIWKYQIVQEKEDLFVFRFIPEPRGLSQKGKDELIKRINMACLGEDVKVEFEEVDSIPRNPSGKFQKIISKVRK